jgi:signal transduction histidine kinase
MKLKAVIIISSICLLLSFVFIQRYISSLEYNACDIPALNDVYKNILEDTQTKSRTELEEKYDCRIIIKEESGYSNKLFSALKKSDIIMDYMEGDQLIGKIIFPANSDSFHQLKNKLSASLWIIFALIIIILYTAVFFIYRRILRPFKLLERFADNICVGNLDIPLTMDKNNYFGAFTESFDMMREELKRAKQGEYEANRSKKELVAELSHDIKTPVSTIKALCEILEIKLKDDDALTKIHTINQKADVVDKLISNLFHATLEELEVLKIEPSDELSTIIPPMFADLNHYGKIQIKNEIPGCLIRCDKLRLTQVIDNVINNSYKYAGTQIDVSFHEDKDTLEIDIQDYGKGGSKGDLPLVFTKFYRGENATSHSGSGLGLYLAKQFMEGMGGAIECNIDHGFHVKLIIKKA